MLRRYFLALAGLTPALAAGCGPVFRTSLKVERVLGKVEAAWMPNRLDYTVYQPSHRVALATLEVLKAELAEAKVLDFELSGDTNFKGLDGKPPRPGETKIPDDYPAFWLDGLNANGPTLVNCRSVNFVGKTKDGKKVDAVVRLEIMGNDQRTVVSVQVGRHGDDKGTKDLIDKISLRVQEPRIAPGSLEERAALNEAFAPKHGQDEKKVEVADPVEAKTKKG